jgi:two-component sensor histidine kinase
MLRGGGDIRIRAWALRTHFLLFGAILVLPLAALSGFLLYQVAVRDRDQLEQRMVQIAAGVTADLDRELQRRISILQTLATSPALAHRDFPGFHAQASAALLGDGTGIFLIDRSLQQVVNTYVPFGTALPPYGAADTAQRALQSGSPQVSDFFIGRVTKRPAFDIVIPVPRKNDEGQYLLAMGLEPFLLQRILRGQSLPQEWVISIADRVGIILARSREPEKFIGIPLPAVLSEQTAGTTAPAVLLEGGDALRATARSGLSDWQVAVNFPVAAAEALQHTNVVLIGGWTVLALVLTAAGATWFARTVARPLQIASQAAEGLVHNREMPPFQSRVVEANELVRALQGASLEISNAQKQQQLLLKELNHRVKNLLSVVIAITMRTLPSNQSSSPREQLIQRLYSLGRSHDLLIETGWQGASLPKIVLTEMNPYAGRIHAEGPEIILNPNSAQTVTMILHELATNAAKYGALSASRGRVNLSWSVTGDREPSLNLTWLESGGPAVSPPLRKGFGAALLEDAIPGSGTLTYRPDGLLYELEVLVSSVVEPSIQLVDNLPREVMRFDPLLADDGVRTVGGQH